MLARFEVNYIAQRRGTVNLISQYNRVSVLSLFFILSIYIKQILKAQKKVVIFHLTSKHFQHSCVSTRFHLLSLAFCSKKKIIFI